MTICVLTVLTPLFSLIQDSPVRPHQPPFLRQPSLLSAKSSSSKCPRRLSSRDAASETGPTIMRRPSANVSAFTTPRYLTLSPSIARWARCVVYIGHLTILIWLAWGFLALRWGITCLWISPRRCFAMLLLADSFSGSYSTNVMMGTGCFLTFRAGGFCSIGISTFTSGLRGEKEIS